MTATRRIISIEEAPNGRWIVTEPGRDHGSYPTAAQAQKAVLREDQRDVAPTEIRSTEITWITRTEIGRTVVNAVTARRQQGAG